LTHRNLKTVFTFLILAALSALFYTRTTTSARSEDAAAFTAGQKQQMQEIIRQYLLDNPQIIMDSVEAYRQRQMEEQDKVAEQKLGEHLTNMTAKEAPAAGNPDGDVTIVEFFDYNCGYCKRALPDIQKILAEDENLRFVFHDMPILGPTSVTAAKWALAAHKQGKYFEYHVALMKHNGPKNISELSKLAEETGLDVNKMKQDAESDDVKTMLDKSLEMARDIGIQGTPAFVLNGKLIRGYMGPDGLAEAIKAARENKEG